jgi:hypothetical protein
MESLLWKGTCGAGPFSIDETGFWRFLQQSVWVAIHREKNEAHQVEYSPLKN